MPRLGGPAAALRIRARSPELPIILTSGYDGAAGAVSSVPRAQRLDKPYAPRCCCAPCATRSIGREPETVYVCEHETTRRP